MSIHFVESGLQLYLRNYIYASWFVWKPEETLKETLEETLKKPYMKP